MNPGTIPLKVKLRIEAGVGAILTDIGHAEVEIAIPVRVTDLEGDTIGATVNVDTTELTTRLERAVAAFREAARGADADARTVDLSRFAN